MNGNFQWPSLENTQLIFVDGTAILYVSEARLAPGFVYSGVQTADKLCVQYCLAWFKLGQAKCMLQIVTAQLNSTRVGVTT